MKLQDALNTLNLTGNVTLQDAKTAYRKACSQYHPDRNPAGLEIMKAINLAWDTICNYDFVDPIHVQSSTDNYYGEKLSEALNAVIGITGLEVEICGAWVWLSGDTRPVKDILKEAGYRWAPKKKRWYFRPAEYKSKSRGKYSMEDIRTRYGSDTVEREERSRLY